MEKSAERLRNVALIAHAGSGKTSIAEAFLYNGKVTSKLGRVDEGTSNFDFEPEETKRQITISTSFHQCPWHKNVISIIDTPGEENFLSDAKLSLQAAEGAIVVVDGSAGVKVGTEKVWAFSEALGIPRIVFINKMDKERADFYKVMEEISSTFEIKPTPTFLPIGAEENFEGVVDLLKMKACKFVKDGSGKFESGDVPGDIQDLVEEWRETMIENIVEADDELMEKYLEGEELSAQEMEETFVKGVKSGVLVPVVCGSASLNIGISQLMDLITQGIPSPLERRPKEGKKPDSEETIERLPQADAPFSALAFKTIADPFSGKLTVIRVFSGTIKPDSTQNNPNKKVKERIGQLLSLQGKKQESVELAGPGDIIAIAKLKETATGDTLCTSDDPIVYEPLEPMPAVLSYAVEPKVKGTEEKVFSSLARLTEEDPSLKLGRDPSTGESILSGTGQIHLDTVCERLKRKFKVEVDLKPVKVPYRETIKKPAKNVVYRHKKQSGGRGQFAEVHFDITPLEKDAGFEFEEALVGMNVPRNFVPAVEKGINEAMESGVLAGYPVVDLKVRFFDGKSHEVDSSEMAFKIAASMCLKKGIQEANPALLEPIVKMEITVPEEVMGDVMGDLNGRRGRVLGMEGKGKYQTIKAIAPMAEVMQYALDLNSLTGGRGTFSMEHSHYEEVPAPLAEKVVAAAKKGQ